ncbi:transposase [Streptomyces sp. NPDC012389]|uniref:transposase n=1 Tax=Streptomyces sp. NPDC012389 TaxID=3364830 RepID=UPI0036E489C5
MWRLEFKRDAIALVLSWEKTVTEVARDLGVSTGRRWGWVKQAKIDRGEGPAVTDPGGGAVRLPARTLGQLVCAASRRHRAPGGVEEAGLHDARARRGLTRSSPHGSRRS